MVVNVAAQLVKRMCIIPQLNIVNVFLDSSGLMDQISVR